LATIAAIGSCVALTSAVGGVCWNDNEGGAGGPAIIVVTATAEFDGVVAAEDAVIATTFPFGTEAGAV
jgi:hypothetical protein